MFRLLFYIFSEDVRNKTCLTRKGECWNHVYVHMHAWVDTCTVVLSSAQCKSVVSAFWSFCRRSHFMLKIPLFFLVFWRLIFVLKLSLVWVGTWCKAWIVHVCVFVCIFNIYTKLNFTQNVTYDTIALSQQFFNLGMQGTFWCNMSFFPLIASLGTYLLVRLAQLWNHVAVYHYRLTYGRYFC